MVSMYYAGYASYNYPQPTNIRRAILCNKSVDHSPVGAAPTTSSFSTKHMASVDWEMATGRRAEKHLSLGMCYNLY